MIEVALFDLDSTLADTYHRQHMIAGIKASHNRGPTWDDYSMACADDTPIAGTAELLRRLSRIYPAFIITGRSAAARDLTWDWLRRHNIPAAGLLMRPAGDRTSNGDYKVAQIQRLRHEGYEPVLFVEDYPKVAREIRERTGIPVLLVNPDYPEDAPHQNVQGV